MGVGANRSHVMYGIHYVRQGWLGVVLHHDLDLGKQGSMYMYIRWVSESTYVNHWLRRIAWS